MSTKENLEAAFAGESQANRKYLAFAKKADEDGSPQIAKLFRAAADAETVHAHNHLNVLEGVGSIEENLKAAIAGELYEYEKMYPKFIEEAKNEQQREALISFVRANKVEQTHHDLYKKALENLGQNEEVDYYVCQVCGHTAEGEAPEACPVCGQPQERFNRIT